MWLKLTLFLVSICLIPSALAQPEAADDSASRVAAEHKYGVGLSGSILSYGVSGIADLTPKVSVQASIGALGAFTALGGTAWYRFNQHDSYDLFGFAGASYVGLDTGLGSSSAIGFGGGAGIEWDWGELFNAEDFPPLFGNATIGLYRYSEDLANLSFFYGGGGLYYRF